MTSHDAESDRQSRGVIDGIVEIRSEDRVVSRSVTRLEDQVQVEITTEAADGTYEVSTYRFFVTRSGDSVVPKYEVDREFRLLVVSELRNAGYEPEM